MAAALGLLPVVVACADGDADGHAASSTVAPETQAAQLVCARLRTYTNDLAGVANDAVSGISALTPSERTAAILEGFDQGLEVVRAHEELVADLDLPESVPEAAGLHDDLVEGAAAAERELTDERATFERDVPVIGDSDVPGRVSQFFNAFEKAMSVVEPAIAAYDRRALSEGFLDEPSCRHVIQQFPLD